MLVIRLLSGLTTAASGGHACENVRTMIEACQRGRCGPRAKSADARPIAKDADQTETRERRMFPRPHATAGRPVRDLALATALLAAAAFWAPAGRAADTPSVDQALHDSLPDQYKKN